MVCVSNYRAPRSRHRVSVDYSETVSKTQQQFAKACNINNIVANARRGMVLPSASLAPDIDVSDVPDFDDFRDHVTELEGRASEMYDKVDKSRFPTFFDFKNWLSKAVFANPEPLAVDRTEQPASLSQQQPPNKD